MYPLNTHPILNPCDQVCGRTDEYRIGLHDLADEIRERKMKQQEHRARINHAALQIQVGMSLPVHS